MSGKSNHSNSIILLGIIVLSLVLRAILVSLGGQDFIPDEVRYNTSLMAAELLWKGNIAGCLQAFNSADHLLFKVIGILPALFQINYGLSLKFPALLFSISSVASLWLVWKIMLRTGESERAALLSMGLFSLCSTQLYFSRHLVPYDMAMTFGLLAAFIGLRTPARAVDSILCGACSACCFLTYNGYWLLGGFAMLAHVINPPKPFLSFMKRALLCTTGLVLPVALLIWSSAAAGGDLLGSAIKFSGAVNQGAFSEGWELPISYLWHTEHLITILWGMGLLFGFWDATFGSRRVSVRFALLGFIFTYGMLVLFSVFFQKFVVYGRLWRQMTPFLCMLAALFLDRIWTSSPRKILLVKSILVIVVCQAAFNFRQFFTQTFPSDFMQLASAISMQTFPIKPIRYSDNSLTIETEKYRVRYAHYIYPGPRPFTESDEIILERPHPQQSLPYQYEGNTPEERARYGLVDITMKLVKKKTP